MEKDFSHYLITRFNVPNSEWRTSIEEGGSTWDEWMEERIELFRSYCVPSVKNQSDKNFTWIVCIDANTEKKYMSFFENLVYNNERLKIIKIPTYDVLVERISSFIENDLKDNKEYVITSRLDNDDAIERRFISRVQNKFEYQEFKPILISSGYQLVLNGSKSYVKKVNLPKGPFISLVEKVGKGVSTVLSKSHRNWDFQKVKRINKNPSWLQLIHGRNVANSEAIGRTIFNINTKKKFGFDKSLSMGFYEYIRRASRDIHMNIRKKIFEKRKEWGRI